MTVSTLLCLAALSAAVRDQVIDDFRYADVEAARKVWVAAGEGGEAPTVQLVSDQGRRVVEVAGAFGDQPKLGRVYLDRVLDLSLASVGGFDVEMFTDDAKAAGRISLYFHSGNGWYSAGGALEKDGWQTLSFSKASFRPEGRPAGWHKVDRVRVAVWRGQSRNIRVRLRRLAGRRHDVALVIPSADSPRERKSALASAELVGSLLSELGLGSDAIEDRDLATGALGSRSIAILAYNPELSQEAIAHLVNYVEAGGKLFVCYQLPPALGEVLGFARPQYVGKKYSGQFAAIRFGADDIAGLPRSVRQNSWNITRAVPAEHHARVIGRWFDDQGRDTKEPAMLMSDRGAFLTHIILSDDRVQKRDMLAAILGHLAPPLWKQMADSALVRAGRVGHLESYDDLIAFLEAADDAQVKSSTAMGRATLTAARRKLQGAAYPDAVRMARQAHGELVRAYAAAQSSPAVEGRAFWNHSGTGAYDGDWERTARELSAAGFNMILPNMLWGGRAHYASDVLPRSRTFQEYGDQIAQCVAAAKKYGLEVHVWKVNFNLSGAPRDFVEKIRRDHRNQVSADGQPHDWLCPSHPENYQLELASMLEVARNYDVDGLHFDYIRYPGRDKCYCDGCRRRFEAQTGNTVEHWPQDCYSGPLRETYAQWRCDQITRLVKAVHDEAPKVRPGIKISAAVFGAYPSCRETVAQDWPAWIRAGYLDFVCPMDYTQSDANFVGLVSNQLRLVAGRIPVYPGIGQWRLSDDRTIGQVYHARQLGAAGFTIFNLTQDSAAAILPAFRPGVGRRKATPPHRNR